jgi:hypothetical protein
MKCLNLSWTVFEHELILMEIVEVFLCSLGAVDYLWIVVLSGQ